MVTTNAYAQYSWPEFVANLRVDQAWGSAQIMGAIHDVRAQDGFHASVHPSDEVGWAIGAGLKFNLPQLGKGDNIIGQVTYTEGALRYITGNNGTGTLQTVTKDYPVTEAAFGPLYDAVVLHPYTTDPSLELTKAWAITGGFEHHWNANWRTSLWGDYGQIEIRHRLPLGELLAWL